MRLHRINDALEYTWNRRWLLAVISGILLGLSYPPFNAPILQIPAFLLLFRLAEISRSYREAAYWSYISFVIWNLIVTYWMMMATLAGGIAAILANSVLMTIPLVLQRYILKKSLPPFITALTLSSLWVGYEYLHHLWDLAWPWLALGNAWANFPSIIQYISYTGYLGVSFWILLVTALLYLYLTRSYAKNTGWAAIGTLLIFPLGSLLIYAGLPENPGQNKDRVRLVIAQPDFNSYQRYYGYPDPIDPLDEIINISDSVRTEETDAVIWPENAIQPYIANRSIANSYATQLRSKIFSTSSQWGDPIITGATYFEYLDPDTLSPDQLVRDPDSDAPYIYYNAALGIYPDQRLKVYKKANLVPMVERIPFLSWFHRNDPFGLKWHTFPWYGKGKSYTQFKVSNTKTPALVCYDSVFPHWMRGFINRGAGFLTIITNDGWWGNTSGHIQHFAYARLRAIEFRRWVARSANNGISGVIAPSGSIQKRTRYATQATFSTEIPIRKDFTFFARYGAWLPWACLAISFLALAFTVLRKFMHRK